MLKFRKINAMAKDRIRNCGLPGMKLPMAGKELLITILKKPLIMLYNFSFND